jgi:hypothetical protein
MKKLFTVLGVMALVTTAQAQIVINEVYGGGGNSGATYTNDFVELINNGTSSVTLTGAYIQYTSAGATGTFSDSNKLALPTITLAAGQKYLIQMAAGNGGTAALPTPDFIPSGTAAPNAPLALSATTGKIALTSDNVSVTAANSTNVIDFIGWGSGASLFEGSAPAPGTTNTTSISRTSGVDTNNNAADFTTGAPTPENSTSGNLAVSDIKKSNNLFIKNTLVKNDEITFGSDVKDIKIYTLSGAVVKTGSVKNGATLNVAELAKGNYIVTGMVNNQPVSQKILKD